MIDRRKELDDLAAADRRIARAENLIARLSNALSTLDPASAGAAIGRRSLVIMQATLVEFRSTREHFRQLLSGEERSPEAVIPLLADDSEAGGDKDVPVAPVLDKQQDEVLRALLKLEIRTDSPGEFDSLWMSAIQNDF